MKARKPIYLNKNTVALITLFTRPDKVKDIWITDNLEWDKNYKKIAEEAAHELMEQLDGRYNMLFLKALKKEINKKMNYYFK